MARLKALPAIDIIRGFKGTIDFYLWKGLPCARKWPYTSPSKRTAATKAAAELFGAVTHAYNLLAPLVLAAYQATAAATPRTARDVYISGVYGKLHEASMSDFLNLLTDCRDFLNALTALLDALGSVDTDYLNANVLDSVLPDGAASLTEQQSQTAALALLDQLRGALASIATDRLQVRGMDQLHSYKTRLANRASGPISGNDGWLLSNYPANGLVWHVTHVTARDRTTATTAILWLATLAGVTCGLNFQPAAVPANQYVPLKTDLWLQTNDRIHVYFTGGLAGDTCDVDLLGQVFTKES